MTVDERGMQAAAASSLAPLCLQDPKFRDSAARPSAQLYFSYLNAVFRQITPPAKVRVVPRLAKTYCKSFLLRSRAKRTRRVLGIFLRTQKKRSHVRDPSSEKGPAAQRSAALIGDALANTIIPDRVIFMQKRHNSSSLTVTQFRHYRGSQVQRWVQETY